jgi:hypothetical protein
MDNLLFPHPGYGHTNSFGALCFFIFVVSLPDAEVVEVSENAEGDMGGLKLDSGERSVNSLLVVMEDGAIEVEEDPEVTTPSAAIADTSASLLLLLMDLPRLRLLLLLMPVLMML